MTSDAPSSPTLESLSLRYITARTRQSRFTNRTPETVRSILLTFASHVGPDLPARSLTRRHLERWANSLDLAPSTVRHRISTVRAFCQWMAAEDHIRADPSRTLQIPRLPRRVPRGMKAQSIAALYATLPDARAELIVSLMVQEGLRCVEVSNLQLGDVDRVDNLLHVKGKGGHTRVLPLTAEAASALDRYLRDHPASNGPLIRGYDPSTSPPISTRRPLAPGTISLYVSRWMSAAGVKYHPRDGISAHALRHTAATDMLRSGAHLRDVQAALGHADITTTQIYLPTVVHDLRVAMEGRKYKHPKPVEEPTEKLAEEHVADDSDPSAA